MINRLVRVVLIKLLLKKRGFHLLQQLGWKNGYIYGRKLLTTHIQIMAVMIKGSNTQSNVFCESETQISNYSITAVIEQIFLDIKENEVWGDFLNCRILIR